MSGNHNTMSKTLSVNDKLFNISLRGIKSSAAIIEQNLSSKYELRIDTANTRIKSLLKHRSRYHIKEDCTEKVELQVLEESYRKVMIDFLKDKKFAPEHMNEDLVYDVENILLDICETLMKCQHSIKENLKWYFIDTYFSQINLPQKYISKAKSKIRSTETLNDIRLLLDKYSFYTQIECRIKYIKKNYKKEFIGDEEHIRGMHLLLQLEYKLDQRLKKLEKGDHQNEEEKVLEYQIKQEDDEILENENCYTSCIKSCYTSCIKSLVEEFELNIQNPLLHEEDEEYEYKENQESTEYVIFIEHEYEEYEYKENQESTEYVIFIENENLNKQNSNLFKYNYKGKKVYKYFSLFLRSIKKILK